MAGLISQAGRLVLMVVFLIASACCSGSETAFFSLSRRQLHNFRRSSHRLGHVVANLLDKPSDLLGALLLGNLIINTLFFAASSVLMMAVKEEAGVTLAAVVAFLTFLSLVLFGEILPKSMAYAHPERFSKVMALPMMIMVRVLTPAVKIFRHLLSEPGLRLLLGTRREPESLTNDEFKALIEASRQQGLITARQGRLFSEVVNFNLLRVRHVMRARVDLVACDIKHSLEQVHVMLAKHEMTSLFVYEGSLDNIIGHVSQRDLFLNPDESLQKLTSPVLFVPEQKTVESLLQFFRKMRVDTAVVVDEYGGVAGAVQVEDIADALFGNLDPTDEYEPVECIGPFRYRLAGSLPIYEWSTTLGIELDQADVATIGGWVTVLLGRIPRPDDVVTWNHLHFKVEQVEQHRITSLIITIGSHD